MVSNPRDEFDCEARHSVRERLKLGAIPTDPVQSLLVHGGYRHSTLTESPHIPQKRERLFSWIPYNGADRPVLLGPRRSQHSLQMPVYSGMPQAGSVTLPTSCADLTRGRRHCNDIFNRSKLLGIGEVLS